MCRKVPGTGYMPPRGGVRNRAWWTDRGRESSCCGRRGIGRYVLKRMKFLDLDVVLHLAKLIIAHRVVVARSKLVWL